MYKTNKDFNFDIQIKQAEKDENQLADYLTNKKIELKTEKDIWRTSGNACIEYGKTTGVKSGISVTKADLWVQEFQADGKTVCYLMFPIDVIKSICRNHWHTGKHIIGGEDNKSKMLLLPIGVFFNA